jgi:hypothetical protein
LRAVTGPARALQVSRSTGICSRAAYTAGHCIMRGRLRLSLDHAMHDVEEEGAIFHTLMVDATYEELQSGTDLIVKGLTAAEAIVVLEKHREQRAH